MQTLAELSYACCTAHADQMLQNARNMWPLKPAGSTPALAARRLLTQKVQANRQ